MSEEFSSFNDFAKEECQFEGDKKKIEDIINKKILIINYRINKSKFKDSNYTTVQYKIDEKMCITFTGSEVITKQLDKYKDRIPFYTKIIKKGKYYSLS